MKQIGRRGSLLVILCIGWGVILGMLLLTMPIQQLSAMSPQVPLAGPTSVPPPSGITTEMLDEPGDELDSVITDGVKAEFYWVGAAGLGELDSGSISAQAYNPITVTVGHVTWNPISQTVAAFEAYGGYRYMRVVSANVSNLLYTQFWYPSGHQGENLYYWDATAQQWKRVGQVIGAGSSDVAYTGDYTYTDYTEKMLGVLSTPKLTQTEEVGMWFAWGHTLTAQIPYTYYFPVIFKNYP